MIGGPPKAAKPTFSMGGSGADPAPSPPPEENGPVATPDEKSSVRAADGDYVVPVLQGDDHEAVEGYLEIEYDDDDNVELVEPPNVEGFMRVGGKWISVKLDQFSMEGVRFIVKGNAPTLEVVALALREAGSEEGGEENPVIHCKALVQEQRAAQGSGEARTVVSADFFEFMCDKGRRPLKDFLERMVGMERAPTTCFRTEQRGVFFDFDRAVRKRGTPLLERSKIMDKHLKEAEAADLEKRRRLNAINDKRE